MSEAFQLENIEGVLVVGFDLPDGRVNVLKQAVLSEFEDILDKIEGDEEIKAAVLISRKKDSFIVGADINEFADFESKEQVVELIKEGHALFNRVERLKKPIVAAIHGACVGGGLELVMSCHYRLASEHKRTMFALPEVNLGLLPGLGGTQRLPRLVGLQKGLELILAGKNVYAKPAKKMGIVDALIHAQGLEAAAVRAALGLVDGSVKRRDRKVKTQDRLLEGTPLNRIVYSKAAETVEKRTRGNYPAPAKIIHAIRTGLEKGLTEGFQAEAEGFAELVFTPESKALRHLFFAKGASEKNPLKKKAKEVKTIGILGAGLMGSGIGHVSAQNGYNVLLKDMKLEFAAKGKGAIHKDISKRVKKGMSAFERDVILERVTPTEDYDLFPAADITIEAVLERLDVKQAVLKDVEAKTGRWHVFATNTSSIPIYKIAEAAKRPTAVLGMHYFSPVPKMPLLEIIKTDKTADWALATAIDVGLKQKKTIIVVGDKPGFYANRILAPYMNEALVLLKEGAAIQDIDNAMRDFGFPVGPLKLIDEVGMDVGAHVTGVMQPLFAERDIELVQLDIKDESLKGRKSGKGFYTYDKGKSKDVNKGIYRYFGGEERKTIAKSEIQERLSLAMINEAVFTLQEGVIESPKDGDVGAVFGIGFPPFLGGPFFYLDEQGAKSVYERVLKLEEKYGVRFKPAELLKEKAEADAKFYDA